MLKSHKNSISVIKNNIFNLSKNRISEKFSGCTVIIPHICNNIGVFGSGFCNAVRNAYPVVASNYELLGSKIKLGYVQYVKVAEDSAYKHELIFANMIAQNGVISRNNNRPLNYEALVKCMSNVRDTINSLDKEKIEIHCPKFGSGLAGGNWVFIEQLIEDMWSNYTVCVYINK
jgi:hypothetical protein